MQQLPPSWRRADLEELSSSAVSRWGEGWGHVLFFFGGERPGWLWRILPTDVRTSTFAH